MADPVAGPQGAALPEHLGQALLMGLLYSFLNILAPDHLGTLMTLSTVMSRERAFHVGVGWSLGHSLGMAVIGGIMLCVHRFCSGRVNVEKWEHYGDYLIGASMVACALYFICRESSFVVQDADGSYVQQPCECSGIGPNRKLKHPTPKGGKRDFWQLDAQGWQALDTCEPCGADEEGTDEEAAPLVPELPKPEPERGAAAASSTQQEAEDQDTVRLLSSACLGVLQGLCCPVGLVGISFVARLRPAGLIGFLVVFILMSVFGTAALTAGWAQLTSCGIGSNVSARLIYRGSCCFTLVLGLTWITATYFGFLSKLNYTEGSMQMHGTASEASGPWRPRMGH